MKKLFLILLIFGAATGIQAQQSSSRRPRLPADIARWSNRDSSEVLQDPAIRRRLRILLGKKSYADFMESWETVNPVVRRGRYLFSSGCLIHACGHIESAIAIDLDAKTIHAGIFRENEKTKFFNERSKKTPAVIKNWAARLSTR